MAERERFRGGSAHAAGPPSVEEVAARAARLGITPERVLKEYARIAFASLRDIVEWDEEGMKVKPSCDLTPDQVAAIAEIVASASTGKIYRIKMHDKKPVLDAMARHLGMLPSNKPTQNEDEQTGNDGEDPREILARKIARIAAAGGMDKGTLVD